MNGDYSALFTASENLDYDEVARLLAAGHNPNEICPAGWPTFHQAIDAEADAYNQAGVSDRGDDPPSGKMVELYLKAGADPYLQSNEGRDAFDVAWCRYDPERAYHPGALEVLARHGYKRKSKPE